MLLISTTLALGFIHGLGADHLMAITSLSIGNASHEVRSSALSIALRFALGHVVVFVVGMGIVFVLGLRIPFFMDQAGEIFSGCLLIILGVVGFFVVLTEKMHGSSHLYCDDHRAGLFFNVVRAEWNQLSSIRTNMPTILGTLFAIGGLRVLTILAPLSSGASSTDLSILKLFGLVVIFVLGIFLSMGLFGVVLTQTMSSRLLEKRSRFVTATTAAVSTSLGVYLIIS